ncbi:hypothetical protein IMY05_C4544000100 [Salix suchowensis]|nr:hypothetical protein IMY05_C4544000100 [Salix suchowensis]
MPSRFVSSKWMVWAATVYKERVPQAFRWKPRQTKQFWDHISIEYARNECERCDLVVKFHDAMRMAKQAKYDRQGNTHLKIKQMFSFGRSTTLFRVHKWKLGYQRIAPEQKDGESKIIDDLCEAVALRLPIIDMVCLPTCSVIAISDFLYSGDQRHPAMSSESQFFDEYPDLRRKSREPHRYYLRQRVTFSESVNCVPTTNGFTINSTHRSVIVNYIKGDVFLGPISGGNVGGTNNTNHIGGLGTEIETGE